MENEEKWQGDWYREGRRLVQKMKYRWRGIKGDHWQWLR